MLTTRLAAQILSQYGPKRNLPDSIEKGTKKIRERLFGVDLSIFEKTVRFYDEVKGIHITPAEALQRALNKKVHKQAWFDYERSTVEDIMRFYQEVHVYPFRQPYLRRFGGLRWYRYLVKHIRRPSILEYGCGSAVLTEYLSEKFPQLHFTVADIPSVTLDFVRWKRQKYGYRYDILEIGPGRDGIPLRDCYDLIICQDVLEHTPNPHEIVTAFTQHLSSGAVLLVDFIYAPGGENLERSVAEREWVKEFLSSQLYPVKAIDQGKTNYGIYLQSS